MKNDSALFYTCSLIEYIGREQKQRRSVVVQKLGKDILKRIYRHADVFHCEVIAMLMDVYSSWISDSISNYNSDFYYQSRDYIKECYLAGEVLE